MKTENMLQRFSCISFLFKPPWVNKHRSSVNSDLKNIHSYRAIIQCTSVEHFSMNASMCLEMSSINICPIKSYPANA